MQSKWFVWLSWTLVCTIAGVVVVLMFGEFLGYTILGGAFGLVQWPVLRAYFGRAPFWWFPISLLGWFIGLNVSLGVVNPLVSPAISSAFGSSPYESLAYSMIFPPIVYGALGFSQWLLLRSYLRRSGWWVLASIVAGPLGALVEIIPPPFPETQFLALLGFVGYEAAVYGAITGAVLVRLSGDGRSGDRAR